MLTYIRSRHPAIIDYSLDRIRAIAKKLDLLSPNMPVITVAGTNGKGTVIATMEAMVLKSGQRCGSFSSPYLQNFNEQIRINGNPVTDEILIDAFRKIDIARKEIPLTEFEFTTLAALLIFKKQALDILLLEIGLGGQNDAVNIIDPDITVITTIALDHEEYLGLTLDEIASSESKLLRPNKQAVLGMRHPEIFIARAAEINCQLHILGRDFNLDRYSYHTALAMQALSCLKMQKYEPLQVNLPGRLQFIAGQPSWLIDVAHNLEAISLLHKTLQKVKQQGKCLAVFSMLKDKPIQAVIAHMKNLIDQWFIAPIDHARGADLNQLCTAFQKQNIPYSDFENLDLACQAAKRNAAAQDLILTFGSFHVARAGLHHVN